MLDEQGASTLDHLISVYEATGVVPPELHRLQSSDCPYSLYHVWVVFTHLSATRSSNGFGPNPITYQEIESYLNLGGIELTSDEVDILKNILHETMQNIVKLSVPLTIDINTGTNWAETK